MGDFFVGIVVLLFGAAVCLLGLRLWFVMLPIWGFVAGFFTGALIITGIFGDGFLSTVTGWVVGFFVGLLFAAVSYLFWYVGALIAAGSVGALIGSGFMHAIGVDSDWLVFIVAAALAAVFVIVSFIIALPVYIVVVNTAIAGATGVIVGLMLVFNRIDNEELDQGAAIAMIQESWFWVLALVVVAVVGMVYQLNSLRSVTLPDNPWTRAQSTYAV